MFPCKAACKGTKTFRDLSGVRFYRVPATDLLLVDAMTKTNAMMKLTFARETNNAATQLPLTHVIVPMVGLEMLEAVQILMNASANTSAI